MTAQHTLNQWIKQAAVVHANRLAGSVTPCQAQPADMAGKTGLEAMLAGAPPYPHIAKTLDFFLVKVESGTATLQGTPQLKY